MTTTEHRTAADPASCRPSHFAVRLLNRRDELALAASEQTGHDLPGAEQLWREVAHLEDQIKVDFPQLWKRHNRAWLAADVERMHTPAEPRPASCRLCWPRLQSVGAQGS